MDDNITISKAQLYDLKPMAELLSELFLIEDDYQFNETLHYQALTLLFHHKNSHLFVAKTNNRIIGMVTMQPIISTAMGGYVGLIEDMIVTTSYRGRGIGRLLLTSLINESVKLGYTRLSLGADKRNQPAIDFYKKFGFEISNMGLMYRYKCEQAKIIETFSNL